MLSLGETVELSDGQWMVYQSVVSGGARVLTLARIPDGESVMGLGRSWTAEDQPQRVMVWHPSQEPSACLKSS